MERMHADPHVERVLAGRLGYILVGANTGSFKGFTRQLLILIRHEMTTEGELVNGCTFTTQVKNADLEINCAEKSIGENATC